MWCLLCNLDSGRFSFTNLLPLLLADLAHDYCCVVLYKSDRCLRLNCCCVALHVWCSIMQLYCFLKRDNVNLHSTLCIVQSLDKLPCGLLKIVMLRALTKFSVCDPRITKHFITLASLSTTCHHAVTGSDIRHCIKRIGKKLTSTSWRHDSIVSWGPVPLWISSDKVRYRAVDIMYFY